MTSSLLIMLALLASTSFKTAHSFLSEEEAKKRLDEGAQWFKDIWNNNAPALTGDDEVIKKACGYVSHLGNQYLELTEDYVGQDRRQPKTEIGQVVVTAEKTLKSWYLDLCTSASQKQLTTKLLKQRRDEV